MLSQVQHMVQNAPEDYTEVSKTLVNFCIILL